MLHLVAVGACGVVGHPGALLRGKLHAATAGSDVQVQQVQQGGAAASGRARDERCLPGRDVQVGQKYGVERGSPFFWSRNTVVGRRKVTAVDSTRCFTCLRSGCRMSMCKPAIKRTQMQRHIPTAQPQACPAACLLVIVHQVSTANAPHPVSSSQAASPVGPSALRSCHSVNTALGGARGRR